MEVGRDTSQPRIHNRLESIAQRLRIRRIRVAPESMRTIEIDKFVQRNEIDPRTPSGPITCASMARLGTTLSLSSPRTVRDMNMVAIARGAHQSRAHHRPRIARLGADRHVTALFL